MSDAPSSPKTGLRAHESRRIKIEVPEAYKRSSSEVWEELEKYLFTGFVHSPATVAGHSFVFKSLNHHEIRNIEFMKAPRSAPPEARAAFRKQFIAYSVFMVDGRNVLHDRSRNIHRIINVIGRMAPAVQERIVENLAALNSRAHRLYPLTEVYAHENRSRYKWLQLQAMPLHSPMATGIPGTDEMGMNYSQQTWTALNRILDRRESVERDWSNAKFIGSTMSKGVRSIDERDRGRAEKERSDLEDLRMKVLYNYLNRVEGTAEPPGRVQLPDGRMAVVEKKFAADSVEELADQLSAALSGEKDHHDLVIENRIKQLRSRAKMIEESQRKIYVSAPLPPMGETNEIISGSRILGGKADAEAHLARLQELRMKQMESARNIILELQNKDMRDESSDEPSEQGPDRG